MAKNTAAFTGVTLMGETITIESGDMVIIDGIEYCIEDVYEDGCFFAVSNDGDENWFEIDDIG
jgi:hypothetical protein